MRHYPQCGPALAVQLSRSPGRFQPGDTICGSVVRKAHIASAAGRVNIRFLGRCKTKIEKRDTSDNKTDYRGCANFFTLHQTLQTIHEGPVHVAPGGEPAVWPFIIAIPENPNPSSVCFGNSQKHNYISLKPENIVEQPLPGTFQCRQQHGLGNEFEGFVEYWLEATLCLEGRPRIYRSILPIKIDALSTPTAVTDLVIKNRHVFCDISTLRMIPGMENTKLSLKQKAQTLFRSSKVPHYYFLAQTKAPSVIQLEHPDPIPFSIRAIPLPDKISDVIRDVPQVITVESVEIWIKSWWDVMCPSTFSSNPRTESDSLKTSLGMKLFFPELKRHGPIVVPQGEDAEYLNIGEQLELRLHMSQVYAFGRAVVDLRSPLYPSFTTYNIRHKNFLTWAVTLQVADRNYIVKGSQEVHILGPSQEQVRWKRMNAGTLPDSTMEEAAPQYEDLRDRHYQAENLPSYEEATRGVGRASRT